MFLPRATVRSFSPSGKIGSVRAFRPLRALPCCSEAQNISRNYRALGSIDTTCSCIKLTLMAHYINPWVKLDCHGPEEHPTAKCVLWSFSSGPARVFSNCTWSTGPVKLGPLMLFESVFYLPCLHAKKLYDIGHHFS